MPRILIFTLDIVVVIVEFLSAILCDTQQRGGQSALKKKKNLTVPALQVFFPSSSSQGPFVHIASLCAALLSKFMSLFGGIYEVSLFLFLLPSSPILCHSFSILLNCSVDGTICERCHIIYYMHIYFIISHIQCTLHNIKKKQSSSLYTVCLIGEGCCGQKPGAE